MDVGTIKAILFFSSHEGFDIETFDELDNVNKILYVTLKDSRKMFISFENDNIEFYFDEEA